VFVVHAVFFDTMPLPRTIGAIIVAFGVLYPAFRIPIAAARDNSYQRYNVGLASAILQPGDTYLAGADLIHDHAQTLEMLQRLDATALAQLNAAGRGAAVGIAFALHRRPPKLVISNYRIIALPRPLLKWIDAHYTPLSGSVRPYAPRVESGTSDIRFAHAGRYLIDSPRPDVLTIDGRTYRSGEYVRLTAAHHRITSRYPSRLRLIPEGIEETLDSRFLAEQNFYPAVYDY
jgi:hypothetical protein